MIPVIILLTQFRSRERRKLHFRESNFTNFPKGGGGMPWTPPRSSHQRRERCTSISWTTASGTSKCYQKPCTTVGIILHLISFPQFLYDLFHVQLSQRFLYNSSPPEQLQHALYWEVLESHAESWSSNTGGTNDAEWRNFWCSRSTKIKLMKLRLWCNSSMSYNLEKWHQDGTTEQSPNFKELKFSLK